MSDLERRLEAALRRQADDAGRPRPLTPQDSRRVRATHWVVGAFAALALVGAGVAVAMLGAPRDAPQPPSVPSLPTRIGPYTHHLYVLDSDYPSRVAAVRRRGAGIEVLRSYKVGVQAETALSPDGSRLYALTFLPGRDGGQTMATYDTSTGQRVDEAPIETLLPEGRSTEQHKITCCTGLYSSPEGGRLYFAERSYTRHHSDDSIWVGTFDSVKQQLLPESAEIPGCDSRTMVPIEQGSVVVVCTHSECCPQAYSETNDVRWLTIADDGSTLESHIVPLTPPASDGSSTDVSGELAWAVASPDRDWIYAVTRTGVLFVIDVRAEKVNRVLTLDFIGSFEVTGEKVALSSDGRTLFVGTSDTVLVTHGAAQSIQRFDVATWRRTGHVRTDSPFYSLAFGPESDGRLYAMMPGVNGFGPGLRARTIQVVDSTNLEQIATVTRPFDAPVLGMVPPLDGV